MTKGSHMAYNKGPNNKRYVRSGVNERTRHGTFQLHHLPPDIICDILSRLSFKEAARTSMVSRSWRTLWRCYPKLVFTRDTMLQGYITDDHPAQALQAIFIKRVNGIVQQVRSATLKKFVVKFPLLERDAPHIDRWVTLSAASRARRIVLDLCPEQEDTDMINDMYSFPLHVLSGDNCVMSLCLGFVSLTLPPDLSVFTFKNLKKLGPHMVSYLSGFTFKNLKKLGLHMVSIRGDLQRLLLQCDVLEWLSLTQCSLQHRSICQTLRRLRYLRVRNCRLQKLHLQAPNLTEFELTNYPIPIMLGECLNLSMATVELASFSDSFSYVSTELVGGLCHVQDRLSINMTIRTETQGSIEGIGRFNNLKHMILNIDIQGCSDNPSGILRLTSLLEVAPYLQELELNMYYTSPVVYDGHQHRTSSSIVHKHLRTVRMTGFYGLRGQLELTLQILQSATALERLIIDPQVRVPWRPRFDWSENKLTRFGRVKAKNCVLRNKRRHIVEVL